MAGSEKKPEKRIAIGSLAYFWEGAMNYEQGAMNVLLLKSS